jgi:YihY family inner membrane protein
MGKHDDSTSALGQVVGWALLAVGFGAGLRDAQRAVDGDGRAGAAGSAATPATAADAGVVARLVGRLDEVQRRVRPLGFGWAVLRKFADDQAGKLAAIVSYYAFFSIFPLMLAFTSILGFVLEGNDKLREDITEKAADQIPLVGDQIASGTLDGSGLALAIGVVLALWAGLGAMDAVTNAMNEVWDVPIRDRKGTAVRRLRGVLMLAVIGLGLIAATLLAGLAAQLPDLPGGGTFGLAVAAVAVNIGLFLVSFRVLCDRPLPWSWLWPGAILAGIASYVLQSAVGIGLISSRNTSTYGQFTTVIGLLSWFFLLAQATVLSAEINVVRARRLWPRSLPKRPLTEADRRALTGYAATQARVADQSVDVTFG